VHGPALDLARVLATKIGVELEPVEYPRPGAIPQGIQNNEWDVTFLVADPARLVEADFSPPYMQTDYTYLVPAASSKQSVADVDQPGVHIAVPRGDGSNLRLTKMLKHAELERAGSIAAAIDMVRAGQVDAYAGPRVEMKVGPSGSAIRSLIPSDRRPLWSKAMVVSAAETSGR
jgi:polar amino acid transport system substrate-binding protein